MKDAIGDRLKRLRSTTKFRQEDVAKQIGIARTTYAMYEQNQRDPDPTTIVKLAELFNTSTDYLLGRTEDPHGNIVHKQGAGKSGLTLEELKEELKRNNIDIFAYGGFEGFEDLSPEQQQFIIQNVKNSIEMFKKMKEQNK